MDADAIVYALNTELEFEMTKRSFRRAGISEKSNSRSSSKSMNGPKHGPASRKAESGTDKNAAGPFAAPAARFGIAGPWRQGKTGAGLDPDGRRTIVTEGSVSPAGRDRQTPPSEIKKEIT
jgi:hypothetical protein